MANHVLYGFGFPRVSPDCGLPMGWGCQACKGLVDYFIWDEEAQKTRVKRRQPCECSCHKG